MSDYTDGPPMIRASVSLKNFQVHFQAVMSEAVRPMADDIQKQVEASIASMDIERELQQVIDYQAKQTIRDIVKDAFESATKAEEWQARFNAMVEEYADTRLRQKVEEEVRGRVSDVVFRAMNAELKSGLGDRIEKHAKRLITGLALNFESAASDDDNDDS